MIRNWKIANFKSYRDTLSIDLASINVLAGANSSGKSSIIQSILLLKQTLQYGSANRPLALNGPLLRLGGFDDVRNFEAGKEELRLSMEFSFQPEELIPYPTATWARHLNRHFPGARNETLQSLSLDLAFNDKSDEQGTGVSASSLSPVLVSSEIRATRGTDSGTTAENFVTMKRRDPMPTEDEEAPFQYWRYEVELDAESQAIAFADRPMAKVTGGLYSYFIPAWVAVNFDAAKQRAIKIAERIFESNHSYIYGADVDEEEVSMAVVVEINSFLEEYGSDIIDVTSNVTVELIRKRLEPYTRPRPSFDLSRLLQADPIPAEGTRIWCNH